MQSETGNCGTPPKPDLSQYPEIPKGAICSYHAKFKFFQVFKTAKLPHPKTGVERWTREPIGSIRDGVFTISPTYKLKQENAQLEAKLSQLSSRTTAEPAGAAVTPSPTNSETDRPDRGDVGAVQTSARSETTTDQSADGPRLVKQQLADLIDKTKLDQREPGRTEIPLADILLAAMLSALGGATDCSQISDAFNVALKPFFTRNLPELAGMKFSHDTVRQALMLIKPEVFNDFYKAAIAPLVKLSDARVIAADGQAVRATGRKSANRPELHGAYMLMNFYDTENRVCLYHRLIEKKENEITVGPESLRKLNIEGTVITADAMSCQVNFVDAILDGGAHYCLAVKENQEVTLSELRCQFNSTPEDRHKIFTKAVTINHGRIEQYRLAMLPGSMLSKLLKVKWSGLGDGSIAHIVRECTEKSTGLRSEDERFYISSLSFGQTSPERMADVIRAHWGVENKLHWMLDMHFGQDRMQAKDAFYISNRCALNKLALGMLEHYRWMLLETGREQSEPSLQKIMGRCAKSPEIAMECLAFGLGVARV